MTSNRVRLVMIVIAVAACGMVAWIGIRGSLRWYALNKILRVRGVPERLAVQPQRIALSPPTTVHPVNIGYATFDTGSTNPISISASYSGAGVMLTNDDVAIVFMPPYRLRDTINLNTAPSRISAREKQAHPHTSAFLDLLEADGLAAEMISEEAKLLPFATILLMNSDDFHLYTIQIGQKGGWRGGYKGVLFFESGDLKGIIRIGIRGQDRNVAAVFLASQDGTKAVGLYYILPKTSTNEISRALTQVLSSFRFTVDSIDDRDRIKALIREAGIEKREEKETDTNSGK